MAHELEEEAAKLYGAGFTADPRGVYATLRERFGSFAPVELAPGVRATIVLGYDAALDILREPETFRRDPRTWQKTVPADHPLLSIMGYRASAYYSDGATHARFRKTITDSFDRVDVHALRQVVELSADVLIDRFCGQGEADLCAQYASRLPVMVFTRLFGCPPELGDRFLRSARMLADLTEAEQGVAMFAQACKDLVALKRAEPGSDVMSWMITHPARLSDEELAEQIGLLMGMGAATVCNLIGNTLRHLLSNTRFAEGLSTGSLSVEDAIDEVLWAEPPVPNLAVSYPEHAVERDGHTMPAHQPVIISFAAVNADPTKPADQRAGNRSHLAFSAGPHGCPAKNHARVMASCAIDKLLDRLPDLEPAVPEADLTWHPGPFHRALTALPVRFSPAPPLMTAPAPSAPASTLPPAQDKAPSRLTRWLRQARPHSKI
ncbi:cytochrome P450 [Actinocorallia longicatena]|uniref:Cytochrome P450 n=1 Tax=Actinocorallia longicatena TaxID=111803 RepID=A0ABP6QDN1_9ACTN